MALNGYDNIDISKISLEMDEAFFSIKSSIDDSVSLFHGDNTCFECPELFKGLLLPGRTHQFIVRTDHSQSISIKILQSTICSFTEKFSEYGVYQLQLSYDKEGNAHCSEVNFLGKVPPTYENVIHPTFIAVYTFLTFLYFSPSIIKFTYNIFKRGKKRVKTPQEPYLSNIVISTPSKSKQQRTKYRLLALDAFRGLTVMLMVFVNSGGGGYASFHHSIWHGLNFSELPHGWFNFIMGASIALTCAYDRQVKSINERLEAAIRRTTKLIFFGLTVSSVSFSADLEKIPFTGVLQNLGILYFFAVAMDTMLPRRKLVFKLSKICPCLDIGTLWPQWLVLVIAAALHNFLLFGYNVPNCGRGYLGPGGVHLNGNYTLCTGGAAGYFDRLLMPSHLAFGIEFVHVYRMSLTFDPYGPFGLIGQIVQAGEMFILHQKSPKNILKRWLCLFILLFGLSVLLCSNWLGYCLVPIDRKLWTLSYTCCICSSSFLILSLLYFLVDMKQFWSGWPLVYPGTNSVFIYVAHSCTLRTLIFPFDWPTPRTHAHLLFKHLWQVFIWTCISAYLYNRNIFLKV